MLSPKIIEKCIIYCLGNTQRFLERAGGEKGRGKVCPKQLMNPGFLVSAVVLSFSSQVHILKGEFNNKRVCAPKSYTFPFSCTKWTNKICYLYLHIFSL